MGWDRHKLLWDGDGTDKYVLWTTLLVSIKVKLLGVNSVITLTNKISTYFFAPINRTDSEQAVFSERLTTLRSIWSWHSSATC